MAEGDHHERRHCCHRSRIDRQAIARRVSAGKQVVLADLNQGNADAAAEVLGNAGLLALPMLQPDQVTDSLHAYQLAKRGNSLRVMAEAVRWGKRGARINTISPGIIFTPLAKDKLTGPRGEGYRRMIELSPA